MGKYPGYPAGKKRADNTFSESSCCRCRCNFKGVCLPGRVAVTRSRARGDNETSERSSFPVFRKNISPRTSLHILKPDTARARNFLREKTLPTRRETRLLKVKQRGEGSYCFLFSLWSVIGSAQGEKSVIGKRQAGYQHAEISALRLLTSLGISRVVLWGGLFRDFWRA